MVIRNLASDVILFAYMEGKPLPDGRRGRNPDNYRETEVASILEFDIPYNAFVFSNGRKEETHKIIIHGAI